MPFLFGLLVCQFLKTFFSVSFNLVQCYFLCRCCFTFNSMLFLKRIQIFVVEMFLPIISYWHVSFCVLLKLFLCTNISHFFKSFSKLINYFYWLCRKTYSVKSKTQVLSIVFCINFPGCYLRTSFASNVFFVDSRLFIKWFILVL